MMMETVISEPQQIINHVENRFHCLNLPAGIEVRVTAFNSGQIKGRLIPDTQEFWQRNE